MPESAPEAARPILLRGKFMGVPATFLVDSGAASDFVSAAFVKTHGLRTTAVPGRRVSLADGSTFDCDTVVSNAATKLGRYYDRLTFRVMPLEGYDVILGSSWLGRVNPDIDWQRSTVTFTSRGDRIVLRPPPVKEPVPVSDLLLSPIQFARQQACESLSVPHVPTGVSRVTQAIARPDRPWAHQTEHQSLWSTCPLCEEKGWYNAHVCGLARTEQTNG